MQHAATLLRAEGVAVLTVQDGGFATLFSHKVAAETDWGALFGDELLHSARRAESPLTTAIAAGGWGDAAAYGIVTRMEAEGTPLLCVLRHHRPFDSIEIAGAHAAASLLAQALEDGRRVAIADRFIAVREVERTVRNGLETAGPDATVLDKTAADIASSIDATGASIMVVDGKELILRGTSGPSGGTVGQRRSIGEGIAGWVALSGEPIELRGPVSDVRFNGTDPSAADALVLPLRADGRIVGVLSIKRSSQDDPFDALEGTLAAELADELARAVSADTASIASATPPAPALSDEPHPAAAEPAPAARLRVLAVEDQPVMRMGICALLEREGMIVVGVLATCGEAVDLAQTGEVDVALVGLDLADADGVGAIERIHLAAPTLPIVAFTVDTAADRVRDAIRAGASGYLPKSIPAVQLIAALRAAAAGLSALAPAQAAALLETHNAVSLVQKAVARSLSSAVGTGPEAAPRSPEPLVPADVAETEGPAVLSAPAEEPDPSGPSAAAEGVPDRPAAPRTRDSLTSRELELLRYLAEGYTNKEIARAMVLAEDTVKKGVQTLIAKLGATDRTHAVVLALRSALIS
ncbi:MAG TPA: response regulator [Candidatus Limnocylindria bacterium]|jgi:DNA-binding NarL/FixJ family response regulator/putative methionine-R-sulfoxide reductase with GAF domain